MCFGDALFAMDTTGTHLVHTSRELAMTLVSLHHTHPCALEHAVAVLRLELLSELALEAKHLCTKFLSGT